MSVLSYEVDQDREHIVWTISGLGGSEMALLDDLLTGPDRLPDSSEAIARRLEARSGVPVIVPAASVSDPGRRP